MTVNGRNQNQQQFTRMTKVEFPKFSGDDVKGWIFRCEQFFSIDEIPKNQKAKLIFVHLFDTALLWHRQFIRLNGENDAFDTLLSRVDINEEHIVSFYLGGLPAEIKMGVRMFGPKTLADAYRLTNYQEATLEAVKKKSKTTMNFSRGRFGSGMGQGSNSKPPLLSLPAPNTNWKSKPNTPVNAPARKQLTQKEYQEKRAQNLCFYCDKKYTPGHKCAGQLFSLVLVPDDKDCFEDCVDELEENRNSIGIQDLQPQISLNALTGTNNFQIMRVIGTVGKHLVHILVDCESTNNFLDKNMAKKLGCSIRPTGPLAVTVADGNNLVTTSKCKNFKWQFDNTTFTTDVMLLPLEGYEMVLGIQ
ncbi:reverse transcriptase [Tanacetum coccineum]